jgi:hypothetical protein
MNKLIILFSLFCLFAGCDKNINTSSEYWKSFVNETDKDFFYAVRTSAGNDSAFSYGNDSVGFYFAIYGTVTLPPIGPYHIDIDQVFPREEQLYNLTDTCAFLHVPFHSGGWKDSLYRTYISCRREGDFSHEKYMETLVVKDSLFSIMQKDYAMLEKFREYYANQ